MRNSVCFRILSSFRFSRPLKVLANPQNDTDKRFSQIYQLVLRLAPAIFTWLSVSGLRSQAFHSSFLIPNSSFPPSARPKDSIVSSPSRSALPRKEVIQPHLPIRLPCYDFTPVIGLTFGSCLLR